MECGKSYVIIGLFTTDPLEKAVGKLWQGSGGAYFITAQSVIEKVRKGHANLTLKRNLHNNGKDGHSCQHCDHESKEDECEIVDKFIDLEKRLSKETISSLVYIVWYVQKDTSEIEDATCWYLNYGDFIDIRNRVGLIIPSDSCVQWIIFCYVLFTQLTDDLCQSFLTKQI